METIKLVRGDNRPYIKLAFQQNGSALDLSGDSVTVTLRFRSVASEDTAFTVVATKVSGGATGEVTFNFPGDTLDLEAGYYEAEVEIDFDGERQTIYERLKFLVREQFN